MSDKEAKKMELLEKAFAAEVESAVHGHGIHIMQTRSVTLAAELVADGLLRKASMRVGSGIRCTVSGWELTELGRMTYCMTCVDPARSTVEG